MIDFANILEQNKEQIISDLFDFLRIPSISRDSHQVRNAAKWLHERLLEFTDMAEIVETRSNPIVIAEIHSNTNKNSPTVLIYGHYDVQPPDPLNMWDSPPFEPMIKEGRIYARGAGDNKGQLFANLVATDLLKTYDLPMPTVKFIFDGEEELGSPSIDEGMKQRKEFFEDIDLVIVSDGPAHSSWRPTIEFGARGILGFRLRLTTAKQDQHSGNYGGIQPNPVWEVVEILKTMKDGNGRCLLNHFYDDVFTPEKEAQLAAKELDIPLEVYKKNLGIDFFGEEQGLPIPIKIMFRPTFNIRGIASGEVLENAKTIIPKEVIVEFDVRLVPNQTVENIEKIIRAHFNELSARDERWKKRINSCKLTFEASMEPMYTPMNLKWTAILTKALYKGFEKKPVKVPLAGGSLPIFNLYKIIKKPLYILPYAQPDQGNHAPNENLMVEWFEKGIKSTMHLLKILTTIDKKNTNGQD